MLTTGLEILRILAEADAPLTATSIAERVGQHVSNVSRTLKVLAEAGYVRKPTYHSFAADLGVLSLAGAASSRLPAIARTRAAVQAAAQATGLHVALATLFRDQVLYLHRCMPGHEPSSAIAGGWPLHRSVVGLRLLLDLPVREARAALSTAARRYGWERPTPAVPETPAACLAAAKSRLRDGMLALHAWDEPGRVACAIRVDAAGQPPLALSLDGGLPVGCATAVAAEPQLRTWLEATATAIQTALEEA